MGESIHRSWLACDLPGTGSKTFACGVSDRAEGVWFAAASRQIVGKPTPTPSAEATAKAKAEAEAEAEAEADNFDSITRLRQRPRHVFE
jgi:hypothetical protein